MGERVEFVKSVFDIKGLPPRVEGRRDVVFVGRSNVGKSSLLNFLVGRDIAKVGKTPGRTRAINYFKWDFDDFKVYLVDLPGYGFARGDKKEVERWKELIEGYFQSERDNIAAVLVLIDGKVGPTREDRAMLEWLEYLQIPYAVVLTKTDKARQKELSQTVKKLKELGVKKIVKTSSKDRRGKPELLKTLKEFLR
jgi:GTP-binding protein